MTFLRQIVHSLSQAVKQHLHQWAQPDNHTLVLSAALDLIRSKPELVLENALLRQQLAVLRRQTKHLRTTGHRVAPAIARHRELSRRIWQRTVVHYSGAQVAKEEAKAAYRA